MAATVTEAESLGTWSHSSKREGRDWDKGFKLKVTLKNDGTWMSTGSYEFSECDGHFGSSMLSTFACNGTWEVEGEDVATATGLSGKTVKMCVAHVTGQNDSSSNAGSDKSAFEEKLDEVKEIAVGKDLGIQGYYHEDKRWIDLEFVE